MARAAHKCHARSARRCAAVSYAPLRAHSPAAPAAIRDEDEALRDLPESEWLRREAAEARASRPSRPLSAEHKQKISAAQKGRAVNGPVMSPDHKARLAAALRRFAPHLLTRLCHRRLQYLAACAGCMPTRSTRRNVWLGQAPASTSAAAAASPGTTCGRASGSSCSQKQAPSRRSAPCMTPRFWNDQALAVPRSIVRPKVAPRKTDPPSSSACALPSRPQRVDDISCIAACAAGSCAWRAARRGARSSCRSAAQHSTPRSMGAAR